MGVRAESLQWIRSGRHVKKREARAKEECKDTLESDFVKCGTLLAPENQKGPSQTQKVSPRTKPKENPLQEKTERDHLRK